MAQKISAEAPAVSPSNPKQGDTVTVTPKPDQGRAVDKTTVTDKDGKPVEVIKRPNGTYTFQQSAGTVTIDVTDVPLAEPPWENPFTGVLNGCGDGRLGPRGQAAQMRKNFIENQESERQKPRAPNA